MKKKSKKHISKDIKRSNQPSSPKQDIYAKDCGVYRIFYDDDDAECKALNKNWRLELCDGLIEFASKPYNCFVLDFCKQFPIHENSLRDVAKKHPEVGKAYETAKKLMALNIARGVGGLEEKKLDTWLSRYLGALSAEEAENDIRIAKNKNSNDEQTSREELITAAAIIAEARRQLVQTDITTAEQMKEQFDLMRGKPLKKEESSE